MKQTPLAPCHLAKFGKTIIILACDPTGTAAAECPEEEGTSHAVAVPGTPKVA
jgi:hypothetical protein